MKSILSLIDDYIVSKVNGEKAYVGNSITFNFPNGDKIKNCNSFLIQDLSRDKIILLTSSGTFSYSRTVDNPCGCNRYFEVIK
jgi:hypothetical protein